MTPRLHHDDSPDRPPTAAEEMALRWVVRCEQGLGPDQERELADWLAADAGHRELYAEFGGTWALLGRADAFQARTVAPAPATVVRFEPASAASEGRKARRSRSRSWLPLAAAAAIAFGAFGWWRAASSDTAVATTIGVTRALTLSDGSVVELNTDSAIVTKFTPTERRVQLTRGEAYFQVAKNPARPFIVEAAGVGVRAIGTAFNVRLRSEGVEVLVTEGKVHVASPEPISAAGPVARGAEGDKMPAAPGVAELRAGERIVVPSASAAAQPSAAPAALEIATVPADEVQRRLAWQERRLEFSDTSLGEVVAEFNRYNRHKIFVTDPQLALMRFGGSFRPDDRVGFVRMLREHFGIQAEEREHETILHSAR